MELTSKHRVCGSTCPTFPHGDLRANCTLNKNPGLALCLVLLSMATPVLYSRTSPLGWPKLRGLRPVKTLNFGVAVNAPPLPTLTRSHCPAHTVCASYLCRQPALWPRCTRASKRLFTENSSLTLKKSECCRGTSRILLWRSEKERKALWHQPKTQGSLRSGALKGEDEEC